MTEVKTVKRLTESVPGRMAGWLLALLWLYSLSGVDAHAFSNFPVCVVLVAVAVLVCIGVLMRRRIVRMSLLGWFSLAVCGYFFCRCLNSYAIVESWGESMLIIGVVVYYVAGVYVAQNRGYGSVVCVLAAALLLSMLAMWAAKQPWFCLEWTGRAAYTPEGRNSIPKAWLVYKNFAGFFLFTGGVVLGGLALWWSSGYRRVILLLIAAGSIGMSFLCSSRAPFLLAPIALVGLWLLDVLLLVCSGRRVGRASFLIGAGVFVLALVGVYDFFFGRTLSGFFDDVDSHDRYHIWASVCELLPRAPWCGFGAGATEWEVIPVYKGGYLPNYAHNEYLQLWLDYGVVGLMLMVLCVILHIVQGMRCFASDKVSHLRRCLVAGSIFLLVSFAAYATADYPGHSFGLISMCAFACGVLASPFSYSRDLNKWRSASQAPVVMVRAERWHGVVVMSLLLVGVGGFCAKMACRFYPVWYAQWEYNDLSKGDADPYAHKRRAMIGRLLPAYPDAALMDTYYLLPHYQSDWKERERLLRIALEANPKQLFTLSMLVDALGRLKRYAEADRLMRESYTGDAMPASPMANWPAYYALNLMMWAREDMAHHNYSAALSKIEYSLAIHQWEKMNFNYLSRAGREPWVKKNGIKPWLKDMIEGCKQDLHLLKLLQVQPDHSWRQPYEPGGKPSLYSSVVDKMNR